MSKRKPYNAWGTEKTCAKCGKEFIPAPQHIFRAQKPPRYFCSWTCYNHRNDK